VSGDRGGKGGGLKDVRSIDFCQGRTVSDVSTVPFSPLFHLFQVCLNRA
jgi:hypothetical protein